MYLGHFGLTEPPFRITPHTDFFFEGANRGATLDALIYAIVHDEGIVKVSGEVGSGKTMLCRVLLERLPTNVETIYLATPSLSRDEILRAIGEDLKVDVRGKRTTLLLRALQEHLIERYAAGGRVVVLIDEAHAMPPETLEEIRLLSNLESSRHKLLQIVLFGQPELDERLAAPEMRQLKERITHSFKLEPLVRSDIDSYVEFRMRAAGYKGRNAFSPAAMKLIAKASEGLTRRINILADKSLLAAFADNSHEVTTKHARAAIRDSEFSSFARKGSALWLGLAGALAGALLVLAAQRVLAPDSERIAPRPAVSTPPAPVATMPAGSPGGVQSSAPLESSAPRADAPIREEAPSDPAPAPSTSPGPGTETAPTEVQSERSQSASSLLLQARVPQQGKLVRERYLATQTWLTTEPGDRYSIQLLTASDGDQAWMENFLQRATEWVKPIDLYVYSWKVNGRQSYRVALGSYATQQEAASALSQLPAALKTFKPYPESVAVIRRLNAED